MKKISLLTTCFLLGSTILVSGCVSREQADAKLQKGCMAAASVFMDEGFSVKNVTNSTFTDNTTLGHGYRNVKLEVVESDGWYDNETEYSCIFLEEMGPFGMSHRATFYQLKMNGDTYGQEGNQIIGTLEDHQKLTDVIDRAMNY